MSTACVCFMFAGPVAGQRLRIPIVLIDQSVSRVALTYVIFCLAADGTKKSPRKMFPFVDRFYEPCLFSQSVFDLCPASVVVSINAVWLALATTQMIFERNPFLDSCLSRSNRPTPTRTTLIKGVAGSWENNSLGMRNVLSFYFYFYLFFVSFKSWS